MGRKEELLGAVGENITLVPLVNEAVFLEQKLDELKKLPFLKVHPNDPTKQKATPAQKQYKELLQQYSNIVKILVKVSGIDEQDEESPLRKWVKSHMKE